MATLVAIGYPDQGTAEEARQASATTAYVSTAKLSSGRVF